MPRCSNCGESRWDDEGRCQICRHFPTLGYQVGDYIEAKCAIPDREQVGEPFLLTQWQWKFLLNYYRINPHTERNEHGNWKLPFTYARGGQLCRPQKAGKGPFAGAIIAAEATGPVRFDGWDANGHAVGAPWATPIVQISASSEDQTDNTWLALIPMITLGDFAAEIPDTAMTRIYLPGGGWIEPTSSSARSRLGQRITFLLQDQTESWDEVNGGRKLADTQRRNIAGMGGRWCSTCNAYDPAENSVAQYTAEEEIKAGDVYVDDIEPPEGLSIRNKGERRKALRYVYQDSHWIELDRIESEVVALLKRDPAQAERWYFNRKRSDEAAAWSAEKVSGSIDREHSEPARGRRIVLFVDGARFVDSLAVIATDVIDGYQWPIGIWESPRNAPDDYEHPLQDVYQAVDEAWKYWDVWRMGCDPQYIEGLVEKWQGQYGTKKVVEWFTNRPRQISAAVRQYTEALGTEAKISPDPVFIQHLRNAYRQKVNVYDEEHRQMHTIAKERHDSPNKMDAAMAAVGSWEMKGDCVAAGKAIARGRAMGFS